MLKCNDVAWLLSVCVLHRVMYAVVCACPQFMHTSENEYLPCIERTSHALFIDAMVCLLWQ